MESAAGLDAGTTTPSDPGAENAPPAVDINSIEQQKENIQPLENGRSASQLNALFSARTPGSARRPLGSVMEGDDEVAGTFNPKSMARILREGHAKYKGMIEAMERAERGEDDEKGEELLDDPLDVYLQYVRWTLESYTSGGTSSESRLIPLLESATRKFVRDPRYRSDLRYLKLWTLYGRQVNRERSRDIYRFLLANEIGTGYSLLYEEYASALEQSGAAQEADAVFNLGIHRKATPLERLKKRREAFTARMVTAPTPASSSGSGGEGASRPARSRHLGAGGLKSAGSAPTTKANPNAAKLAVFRDGDEPEQQGTKGQASRWDDLGTVKENERENKVPSVPMAGQTMPMGNAVSHPESSARIPVFRDDDAYLATPAQAIHPDPAFATPSSVFAPRSARDPTETELLQRDPLRNYSKSDVDLVSLKSVEKQALASASASKPAPKGGVSAPSKDKGKGKAAPPPSANGERRERVACDLSTIYPVECPGSEFSWEESRAKRYLNEARTKGKEWGKSEWEIEVKKTAAWHHIALDGAAVLYDTATGEPLFEYLRPAWEAKQAQLREEATRKAQAAEQERRRLADEEAATKRQAEQERQQWLREPAESGDGNSTLDEDWPAKPPSRNRAPSPTMNTKAALAEVDDMFAKTLNLDKYGQRDDDDEDPDDYDDTFWEKTNSQPPRLFSQSARSSGTSSLAQSQQGQSAMFSQSEGGDEDEANEESRLPGISIASVGSNDGNGSMNRSLSGSIVPLVPRPASGFKPTRRAPLDVDENGRPHNSLSRLAAGPGHGRGPLQAKAQSIAQRLFTVRQDSQPSRQADQSQGSDVFGPEGDIEVIPESQPDQAEARREEEDGEEDEEEEEEDLAGPPLDDDYTPSSSDAPVGAGYDMGRQFVSDRFAHLSAMTPIVERTCEFTGYTEGVRSRPLVEEDEDEDEEDEGAGGITTLDKAFVAEESVSSRSDDSEGDGEATETEADSNLGAEAPRQDDSLCKNTHTPPSLQDPSFEGRTHQSFDRSDGSLHLPAGLEVAGNQSGYTVEVVLDKTNTGNISGTGLASPELKPARGVAPPTPTAYDVSEPICPFEPEITECLLGGLEPPLADYPSYRDLSDQVADKMAGLQKRSKARGRRSGGSQTGKHEDQSWEIELGNDLFFVRDKLGEGRFGAVFRVAQAEDGDATFDEDGRPDSLALKVERPSNLWEYAILIQLQERLPPRIRQSVISSHRLYAYSDESFLLIDYCDQGTLLHAINKAAEAGLAPATAGGGLGVDEVIAMFFTIELLRVVEGLHAAGFIHGDLKVDNCLVRLEDVPGGARAWSSTYDRTGGGGWAQKGLKLIDYGRAVDTTVFPEGQKFLADWVADKYDCVEVQNGQPWTFELDYHGVASIAYCMLFGSYMTEADSKKPPFRRYHQAELWTSLFGALLQPEAMPNTRTLADIRSRMEDWLEANSERAGKSLKGYLKKLEIASMTR